MYNLEEGSEAEDSEDSHYEWANSICSDSVNTMAAAKKSARCKMLVECQEVSFLIDTGASINILPARYTPKILEPYKRVVWMWNLVEEKPLGCCRLKVVNPKNKKYSVPFIVFKSERSPIIGFQNLHRPQSRHSL